MKWDIGLVTSRYVRLKKGGVMRHQFLGMVALTMVAGAVCAFNPPSDEKDGVTLSIADFPEQGVKEHWSVRKVPADQPLTFTVTLKNTRAEPVGGPVKLWLNDDWYVVGTNVVTLRAEPGKSVSATCTAAPHPTVLSALYPVHAQFAFQANGQAVELHPIAVFEAQRPAAVKAAEAATETALTDGVLRLDGGASRQVFYRQSGAPVALGVNFSASDAASGMNTFCTRIERGGVARSGFAVHPPYRGSAGVAWSDFKLALPAGRPIQLKFFTALRDTAPTEPASDGTEFKVFAVGPGGEDKELFTRFSASKVWEPATVDLGAYAGQSITLRLWTGPGPKNDTTCDQCYWGDPVVAVGTLPPLPTEAQWQAREKEATARAQQAAAQRPARGSGAFQLSVGGQAFGAAVVLGEQGLTDAVFAFSDGARALTYRGFACDIDQGPVGGAENGQPVLSVETTQEGGDWVVRHAVAQVGKSKAEPVLAARAKIRADGGALRIAWDMPGAVRDARGTPRYTRLGIGACGLPVWRAYAGFGNVMENPGAFDLGAGGFSLSTRHVGADYTNGLSLVQACDIFPDHVMYAPATRRFALETEHDASFLFVPSAHGAFAAARAYRDLTGFEKGGGVDTLKGRVCFDQWGGDYRVAEKDLQEAARYGLNHAIFVKHDWQRWGYDYRLPEIFPPAGGLEPFRAMREAARQAGILFCPHDNYIDFYPDAEGYSYDRIVFQPDGQPEKAWLNEGRLAQSYRWMPHAFRPWLESNMAKLRDGFAPDSLFIDVFTAIQPFDYYDRAGTFYPRMRTVKEWRAAFDTCRSMLKDGAPMISEAGADGLIGSIDAGEADHFPAKRLVASFGDAERTPWHDMATHGKMVLLAGGLGSRYSADNWDDNAFKPLHGYGSDDYLSNTVIGGRNPMCDGPFSRRAVMTYWLLHDACDALAHQSFEAHEFGATVRQQHTAFGGGGQVWSNRGTNLWKLANGLVLPEYGFYAQTREAEAGIVLIAGQRAAFAKSEGRMFADARPTCNPASKMPVESSVSGGTYLGDGAFDVAFDWNVLDPSFSGYVPFIHVCAVKPNANDADRIAFQANMAFDRANLTRAGAFIAKARIAIPHELPAGEYQIRYGLYHHGQGHRLAIRGLIDGQQRVRGGVLKVEKNGSGAFTSGIFTPETVDEDALALGLNVGGKMLDFGPLVTDGAFRLLHPKRGLWQLFSDTPAWQLIPLPGSKPFRAEIRLASFGEDKAQVKAVEKIDPFGAAAKDPLWMQDGNVLHIECDGQSFAYRITFD